MVQQTKFGHQNSIWTMHTASWSYPKRPKTYVFSPYCLRQRIGPQHSGGFQPQMRRSEQWTVDPFWEMDRPTPAQYQDLPWSSTVTSGEEFFAPMPMEEGKIESETDPDPSILEVSAINWARYVGVKSVQYVKTGHRNFWHKKRTTGT